MARPSASGISFIVVSACAFGAMAIFARFAYASGANVTGILAARFAVAGLLLAAVMLATNRPWPRGRPLAVAIGMGAVGYVGQAMCFFAALNHASAGLVALLLYTYPTLVVLLSAAFGAMAIFARFAYADGVDTWTLLALRFAIAAACLGVLAKLAGNALPRGRDLAGAALMGGVGYAGQAATFFTALGPAPAGIIPSRAVAGTPCGEEGDSRSPRYGCWE